MGQTRLLPMIREQTCYWLRGYIHRREIMTAVNDYIVAPGLGPRAGVMGALALAMRAAGQASER